MQISLVVSCHLLSDNSDSGVNSSTMEEHCARSSPQQPDHILVPPVNETRDQHGTVVRTELNTKLPSIDAGYTLHYNSPPRYSFYTCPRNFNGSGVGGGGGNDKLPPLGSSSSASDGDGEKKPAGLGIFWAAYISLLDTQPILTKSLTSMTGFALGDLLAQKFLEKKVREDDVLFCL